MYTLSSVFHGQLIAARAISNRKHWRGRETDMDADRDYREGRVPLREFGDPNPAGRAGARRDSIRHVRRMSNWTAAMLIVGTGAAAAALAHQAFPAAARLRE